MFLKKEAFILNSIVEDEQLNFIGRAIIDMKVGDILLYENGNIQKNYVIINIIAYKHELDEISSGMTCKLLVTGNVYDFQQDTILYKID